MPNAWSSLIEGLTLLARGQNNAISPLHCEHDELTVCADPQAFDPEELELLRKLGFVIGEDDCFVSYRFGSA